MPHLVLEYSDNLPEEKLAIPDLLETLCHAAVGTGLFQVAGLRARAYCAKHHRVGSGNAVNGFLHVSMMVGRGRTQSERESAAKTLFEALKSHLKPVMAERPVALSFEMRELDDIKMNFRNL
ncbi:5-carboxymethyl-2-hydroxymuconate isomerase [Pseudohaliea sp.]|uniref:5-carboxymethyl-2-hydroxymuconate isomerase n=1 Tax=Pseudohaliea sp. TaxID=2740289 RepID=UPI0032EDD692